MKTASTPDEHTRRVQVLHGMSALLILLMIPLGFYMQRIESQPLELLAFRIHVLLGIVILALTLLPDLSPLHARMVGIVHVLLYLVLLGLSISGLILLMQSGLAGILLGQSAEPIPANLNEYLPRKAHGAEARIYIALLLSHVAGVLIHQLTKGEVLARMGIRTGQLLPQRGWLSALEAATRGRRNPGAGAQQG